MYIYSVYNIIYRPPRLYKNKRPAARAVVISRDTPFTEGVSLKGGRLSPCRKSKTIITHTAVNGPSGFKSKHLNFFCRRCYRVKILILRKCHLGNFPQIHFNPIIYKGWGDLDLCILLKTLSCFLWIFYNICFHINGRDPQFCNLS